MKYLNETNRDSMSRDTIDSGFLDGIFTPVEPVKSKPAKKRQKITLTMDSDLVERLKNTVYWSPGLSLCSLLEEGAEIMVNQLEKENGKPFPERNGELKKGRKLS
jgi:hypothetical protein